MEANRPITNVFPHYTGTRQHNVDDDVEHILISLSFFISLSFISLLSSSYHAGPHELEALKTFIRAEFLNRNRDANKTIYPHFTCATDTNMMQTVWEAVTDTVVQDQLNRRQLL